MSSLSKTVLLLSTMHCISILKIMLMQCNTVKGLLIRHPLEAKKVSTTVNWSLLLVELFSYEIFHGESLDCTCSLSLILFSARACIHAWSPVVMTKLSLELKSGNEYVVINSDLNNYVQNYLFSVWCENPVSSTVHVF